VNSPHPGSGAAPGPAQKLDPSDAHAQGRIARLFVYPIKSCAGVELSESVLTPAGLDYDRAWMVVDERGGFVTQRELPRLVLVQPKFRTSDLVLRAPGMLALHLALDSAEQPCKVQVWDDEVNAYDMGDLAAQWFSDFLLGGASQVAGRPRKLRLARFDPGQQRLSSPKWTGGVAAQNQFADGFALLLTSLASHQQLDARMRAAGHLPVGVERFRPNIVLDGLEAHDEDRIGDLSIHTGDGVALLRPVKPCARCTIPNVDPATAQTDPAVSDQLQGYRQNPRMDGAVTFGTNAIVIEGDGHTLRVGQPASASFRFD
jgi:uncharacterized protein YcbX